MRRKIGIFWKYFIAYSATATVVIFILAILMNISIRGRYQKIVSDDLEKYAILARTAFRDAFDSTPAEIQELVRELGIQTGARITLINPDGAILADSEEDPALMENHSERPEVKKALSGEIGSNIRYSTTLKEKMNYVAIPVTRGEEVKGVVRVSLNLKSIELLMEEFTGRIVLFSVVIWVVALILTFIFSSIFSASVKHIVSLTNRLASGDFSRRAIVRSRDELSELAAGLNDMSQKLQSLFNQFQTQHHELNAIINSMAEGVLVLDRDLRVILANESFRKIFSIEGKIAGRSYIEAARSVALKETIDEIMTQGEVKGKRIELEDKLFLSNGVVSAGDRVVLVFHNVTSDARLEEIKAEFVANASHELRTPIAAIKGYLETFEDEDPETQLDFIQIIRRNVDRISNLVSDLLLLSRLESTYPHLNFETVNLLELASDIAKLVERPARDKNIHLEIDIGTDVSVNGDPFLLEQMLINLLDNAVKYTEHGEVVLRASKDGEEVTIQVRDTGIGIPRSHLPRIFERFYRVDKARSRDLGGTGLGLSIVKHIVRLHSGDISIESQVGTGTTFTISLPSAPSI